MVSTTHSSLGWRHWPGNDYANKPNPLSGNMHDSHRPGSLGGGVANGRTAPDVPTCKIKTVIFVEVTLSRHLVEEPFFAGARYSSSR